MSFNTGLSGLKASSQNLNVIGHNIANANTTGMKASRAEFGELYATAIGGVGGSGEGIGVEVANVAQLFTQGNVTVTGNDLDLAINGAGFFRVTTTAGNTAYTRAGEFKLNKEGFIVTNQGAKLTGFAADDTGKIVRGSENALQPIQLATTAGIPAKQTTKMELGLNLDARATAATGTFPTFTPSLDTYGTSVVVSDQQGVDVAVRLNFVKASGNTWTAYASMPGQTTPTELATVSFNPNGTLGTITPTGGGSLPLTVAVPTDSTVPASTFPVEVDLNAVTQFGTRFSISSVKQDGYPPGELTGVGISDDGTVSSRYSNGQSIVTAQVALTTFRNLQGLEPQGGGYWLQNNDAGEAVTSAPKDAGFGNLRQGALEESNVDLSSELVNMITAQRAYQANAQTIKTQDQVFSTLVNLR